MYEPGTALGPYRLVRPLGAGGMGQVYLATDDRLGRQVAIKILTSDLALLPDLRMRFEREARAVAALGHPHICVLHDVGHHHGADFLVMEYLEGETLSDRLRSGPLPLKQLLTYAIEIADALNAAHRQDIFHRDLKPSNVMLTKVGVKLVDFGLARVRQSVVEGFAGETRAQLTSQGMILGTAAYMAPEQIEGRDADHRSDIFAFGAVFYEMATGRRAFDGPSPAATMGAVLHVEPPPIATVRPELGGWAAGIEHVVRKCLAKDAGARWQSTADLVDELRWLASDVSALTSGTRRPPAAARPRLQALALRGAALIAIAAASFVAVWWTAKPEATPSPHVRFSAYLPPGVEAVRSGRGLLAGSQVAVSPDGRQIAVIAAGAVGPQLWIRPVGRFEAQPLEGPRDVAWSYPFWSADGHFVGMFSGGKLRKVRAGGGPDTIICDAPAGHGGTWSASNVIVFAPDVSGPLLQVAAGGGTPQPATTLDQSRQETAHRWPHFLPDGDHFVYTAERASGQSLVVIGSLRSRETRVLFEAGSSALFAAGHLLFADSGALIAQLFDSRGLRLTGERFQIAAQVGVSADKYLSASVSQNGVLVYGRPGARPTSRLTTFSREGKQLAIIADPAALILNASPSPDGATVAAAIQGLASAADLWLLDVGRHSRARLTFDTAEDSTPVWSPDGRTIVFSSDRRETVDLYLKASNGLGREELLWSAPGSQYATDWSPDGKYVLVDDEHAANIDVFLVPTAGDRRPVPLLNSSARETQARFSPDGRWVAYVSDDSGSWEVFVQPFPASGSKWQVSNGHGGYPYWSADGRELFYLRLTDSMLMSTGFNPEAPFRQDDPRPLFRTGIGTAVGRHQYFVDRTARRFSVNAVSETGALPPPVVVVNWPAAPR
jgi:Tol biopolymer transport system component